MGLYSSSFC
ncbi:uncharacterized protein FFE2_16036 [Fusarium fujikuroi]|nr:uncharacterized protein FFE2_16036 [Fusarium fujikuroi]